MIASVFFVENISLSNLSGKNTRTLSPFSGTMSIVIALEAKLTRTHVITFISLVDFATESSTVTIPEAGTSFTIP